jgi:hypothetical protein
MTSSFSHCFQFILSVVKLFFQILTTVIPAMANVQQISYSFNPGEFVEYRSSCGDIRIGQILTVPCHNLTI